MNEKCLHFHGFVCICRTRILCFLCNQMKWPESQESWVNEVLAIQVANRKKSFCDSLLVVIYPPVMNRKLCLVFLSRKHQENMQITSENEVKFSKTKKVEVFLKFSCSNSSLRNRATLYFDTAISCNCAKRDDLKPSFYPLFPFVK